MSLPDEYDELRDANWKRKLLGAAPTTVLGSLPVVRYVQIRMTPEVANLATKIGKSHGLSREGWLRKVIAEAIADEVPGVDAADVYPRMPKGDRRKQRPETRRSL